MNEKSYGSWISPITSSIMLMHRLDYTYLCLDQNENNKNMTIYFIEMRPTENGRSVIVSRNLADNESINETWTPSSLSVKTRVHEYGGADLFVYNKIVYFSNEYDQHLYMQKLPMSFPERLSQSNNCRYANGYFCGKSNAIFIVREDHNNEKDVRNTIVVIKDTKEVVVVEGSDFYSLPRVSSDGEFLCWVEWNFPNMPWDNTKVCTGKLDMKSLAIVSGSIRAYANFPDSDPVSCMLPMWTRDNELIYINDRTGYWNIWTARTPEQQTNLTPINEDLGGPMWVFDFRTYYYSALWDLITVVRKGGGEIDLMRIDGSLERTIELQPYITSIAYPYLMPDGRSVVVIGGSCDSCTTIYHISIDGGNTRVLGTDRNITGIDPQYYSIPKQLKYSVPGGDSGGSISYGYYYPPHNPDYFGCTGTLPPLLVLAHGGPTSSAKLNLNLNIQYYTSRGFAVLDVNYRGSTGYGKQYRNLLQHKWGLFDRIDCCEGAQYLVSEHLVDRTMLAISGKSAGGYTTLCSLTYSDIFRTGCSIYGVGDLKSLVEDTHKFESRYLDILIGDYQQCQQLYYERSPINYPANIKCAMVFYQGDEDKVVPKEQSEKMYEAVKAQGIPCSLVMYKGERHGFRKAENIAHQIESEYYFYGKVFGFATPGIDDSIISIDNFSY